MVSNPVQSRTIKAIIIAIIIRAEYGLKTA